MKAAKVLGVHQDKEYWLGEDNKTILWRIPEVREAICAKPGYVIVSADYSQIEVKIMAFLSQDEFLIQAINSGKDIHCYMASEMFGVDYELINKARKDKHHPQHTEMSNMRSAVKCVTFGIPYGAGPKRVAIQIAQATDRELTEELVAEATGLIAQYFTKATGLKRWLDNQKRSGVLLQESRSACGRVRWYTLPDQAEETYDEVCAQIGRYSGNQPIQATNADMIKKAMRHFYLAVRGGNLSNPPKHDAKLILVIHDEIAAMCKKEQAEEIGLLLKEAMDWAYDQVGMEINGKYTKMSDLLPLNITVNGKPKDVGVEPVYGEYLAKE
jgi:DNA polymerase I